MHMLKTSPALFSIAPTAAEFQYALLLDYTTKGVAQNLTLSFLIMKMFAEK